MRYLKTYKIFESSDIESIKTDIRDMLLDVSDEGLEAQVIETEHHNFSKCFQIIISKGDKLTEDEFYHGNLHLMDRFIFNDVIEETMARILRYMESIGWYAFDTSIITRNNIHVGCSRKWSGESYGTDICEHGGKFYIKDYYKNNEPIADMETICVHAGFGRD